MMCDERRSFFQVVGMDGENPQPRISINPTVAQFWAGLIVSMIVIAGAIWGATAWVAGAAFDQRFEQRMDEFHAQVVPQISDLIDARIESHTNKAQAEYRDRMERIRSEIATLQAQTANTQAMVWMLYRREFGLQPPEAPPPALFRSTDDEPDVVYVSHQERTP